jgi:hypothetical protein
MLLSAESVMKTALQLVNRHIRDVSVVELGKWQLKLFSKFLERKRGDTCFFKNLTRRLPNGRKVVHQSAAPVEYDILYHRAKLNSGDGEIK